MQESDFYRPPRDDAPPPRSSANGEDGTPVPWEPGEVLGAAWEVVKQHWLVLIFAILVATWVPSGPSWILSQMKLGGANDIAVGLAVWLVGVTIQLVLGALFGAGLCRLLVAGARRQLPDFGELGRGGAAFPRMLGVEVLLGLIGWALFSTTMAPACALVAQEMGLDAFTNLERFTHRLDRLTAAPALAGLAGLMVLMVLSVFITLRLRFAPYYVADAGRGAVESLGSSWKATEGHVGKLVVFAVLSWLLAVAGVCMCCVGFFPMMALTRLAEAIIYTRISGRIGEAPETPY
jgi:hypothetical protein